MKISNYKEIRAMLAKGNPYEERGIAIANALQYMKPGEVIWVIFHALNTYGEDHKMSYMDVAQAFERLTEMQYINKLKWKRIK